MPSDSYGTDHYAEIILSLMIMSRRMMILAIITVKLTPEHLNVSSAAAVTVCLQIQCVPLFLSSSHNRDLMSSSKQLFLVLSAPPLPALPIPRWSHSLFILTTNSFFFLSPLFTPQGFASPMNLPLLPPFICCLSWQIVGVSGSLVDISHLLS